MPEKVEERANQIAQYYGDVGVGGANPTRTKKRRGISPTGLSILVHTTEACAINSNKMRYGMVRKNNLQSGKVKRHHRMELGMCNALTKGPNDLAGQNHVGGKGKGWRDMEEGEFERCESYRNIRFAQSVQNE